MTNNNDDSWSFDDGAARGMSAEDSMKAVVGGKEPSSNPMTSSEMATYLDGAATEGNLSYDEGARLAGKIVLSYLRNNPARRANQDASVVFDLAVCEWVHVPYRAGPQPPLDQLVPQLDGITGFMVGWAVNAARYALGDGPVRNPALLVF